MLFIEGGVCLCFDVIPFPAPLYYPLEMPGHGNSPSWRFCIDAKNAEAASRMTLKVISAITVLTLSVNSIGVHICHLHMCINLGKTLGTIHWDILMHKPHRDEWELWKNTSTLGAHPFISIELSQETNLMNCAICININIYSVNGIYQYHCWFECNFVTVPSALPIHHLSSKCHFYFFGGMF